MIYRSLAKSVLLAGLIAVALPAQAAGPRLDIGSSFFGNHDDAEECLTLEQSRRVLKRMKYKDVNPLPAGNYENVFAFEAIKPKRNGQITVWHIYYNACDREIISKQDQS